MENGNEEKHVSRLSDIIDISRLERENRRYLYLGFLVAFLFHAMLAVLITYKRVEVRVTPPRIVELRLIELPPTKPFIIQGPRLRRNYLFRRQFAYRMPQPQGKAPVQPAPFESQVPKEDIDVGIVYRYENLALSEILPDSLLAVDSASRLPQDTIPLKDTILADTGRYKAEVLIVPGDKKAIQGYVHIALGSGVSFTPPDSLKAAASDLTRLMNRYTNIEAAADKPILLGSGDLFRYPFIVITADAPFELTDQEFNALTRYIMSGGFVIFENRAPIEGIDHVGKTVEALMRKVIDEKYLWIRPLGYDHSLYHCFFDLDGLPRADASQNSAPGRIIGFYNVRKIAAVYCPQGFSGHWHGQELSVFNKIGVNLVVYALAQGGWYDTDNRLAAVDYSTKTYFQWYENGKMQFRASGWLGIRRPTWIPSNRIVQRIITDSVTKSKIFMYDEYRTSLSNNRSNYTDIKKDDHRVIITWGDYNVYEGWWDNGQKMYYYNYTDRTYTEWDDFGMVIEQGGKQRSAN